MVTAYGTMLRYGSEAAKEFNLKYLIPDHIMEAHKSGDIHIHDLDLQFNTHVCADRYREAVQGIQYWARSPSGTREISYAALACIAIQANQNDMHGGQSIPAFDYYLAPGVAKTL